MKTQNPALEPQTIGMLVLCYGGLMISTALLPNISLLLAFIATTLLIALHSSLQHEALHGHPTRIKRLNEALVFPAVGLLIPYNRFRDLHLAHHHDEILTDPYDDPETNFMDPKIWAVTPRWLRFVRRVNNTLAGRILLGPLLSVIDLARCDLKAVRKGEAGIIAAWALHFLGIVLVVWWLLKFGTMPLVAYFMAAYLGLGILKIRTYLEHRADDNPRARSVIITDRGLFALLFLNNNFHSVHHSHPTAAWYRLPGLYDADPDKYLKRNGGYFYTNYAAIFRKYLFRGKDTVPHPLR